MFEELEVASELEPAGRFPGQSSCPSRTLGIQSIGRDGRNTIIFLSVIA